MGRVWFSIVAVVLLGSVLVGSLVAWADENPAKGPANTTTTISPNAAAKPLLAKPGKEAIKDNKPGVVMGFTQAREAAALTFVRTHHPELAKLVESLKATNPVEYQKAINDLFRTSERLAQIQERSPQRYDLALRTWQVDSRIQLLVARLTMGTDADTEQALRKAIEEQLSLRQQQLEVERDRARAQVAELNAQLQDLEKDRAKQVEQQLEKLLKGTKKAASGKPGKDKPAAGPVEKTETKR